MEKLHRACRMFTHLAHQKTPGVLVVGGLCLYVMVGSWSVTPGVSVMLGSPKGSVVAAGTSRCGYGRCGIPDMLSIWSDAALPKVFSLLLCAESAQSGSVHSNPACKEAAQSYCVHCSGNNRMWWRLLPPIGSLLSSQLFCKDNYF